MQKHTKFRVLTVLAVAFLLACAMMLTVAADSVKYDFTTKDEASSAGKLDPEHPELGGWSFVSPTGANVGLTYAEGSVCGYEELTRLTGKANNGILFTYTIPADAQVNIKDYDSIEFNRRLSNGHAVANTYSATYGVTLIMDDGQTITKDYNWYGVTPYTTGIAQSTSQFVVKDNDIQEEIEALEGNPKLVKIQYELYSSDSGYYFVPETSKYKPAVKDDPATEDVDESVPAQTGTSLYFLTQYFTLHKSADIPTGLATVKDTWNGEGEHNGKITGLDASKTYKYAPIHSLDADFVTVTGATEITGLVGGVYEVKGAEEGKNDSAKVIVIIDKDTQGAVDNYQKWVTAENGGSYGRYPYPVSGMWTAGNATPAPSTKKPGSETENLYIAAHHFPYSMSGIAYNGGNAGDSEIGGEYYRHVASAFNYALTPEEQFDVDSAAFQAWAFQTGYPWANGSPITNGESSYAICVYTNGDTENPYIITNSWKSSASVHTMMVNASNELDGYVTSIKYICFYDIPELPPPRTTPSDTLFHYTTP